MSMLGRARAEILAPVGLAPRALLRALDDLRTIARLMQHVPELGAHLESIDAQVARLSDDVARMRRGVESIDGKVDELDARVAELRGVLSPLRRLGRLAARRPDALESDGV